MSETPYAPRRDARPDSYPESRCSSGERYSPELKAFADGELSPLRRFLVARHVNACAPCREEIDAMRTTTDELKRVADAAEVSLSPALRSRLLAAAAEARVAAAPASVLAVPTREREPLWRRRSPVLVFASGAVALVLFAAVFIPLREQAGSVGDGASPAAAGEAADFADAAVSASKAAATTASTAPPPATTERPPARPRPGGAAVPAPAVPWAAEPPLPQAAPQEIRKASPPAAAVPPVKNERSATAPKSGDMPRALNLAVPREKDAVAADSGRVSMPAAAASGADPSNRVNAARPAPPRARARSESKSDGAAAAPSSAPATPPAAEKEEARPGGARPAASETGAATGALSKGMGGVAGGFGAAPGGAPDGGPAPGLRGGADAPTGPAAPSRMGNLVTQNATSAQAATDEIVVTLAVEDVAASEARVRKIVAEADGTVIVVAGASAQSRALQQQESRNSLNLYHQSLSQDGITSRLPADRVEEAVVKLGQIGDIVERRGATFALYAGTRAKPQGGAQQEGVGGRGGGGSRADSAEYQRGAPAPTQNGEARRGSYGAQKSTLVVRLVAKPRAAKPQEPAKKGP